MHGRTGTLGNRTQRSLDSVAKFEARLSKTYAPSCSQFYEQRALERAHLSRRDEVQALVDGEWCPLTCDTLLTRR